MRLALGDFRQLAFRRGIDRSEILTRIRGAKITVNEELVARLDFDVVDPSSGGCVGPGVAKIEPPFVRRDCARLLGAVSLRAAPAVATGAFGGPAPPLARSLRARTEKDFQTTQHPG